MRILLVVLALLCCAVVQAQTPTFEVDLSWTIPTERTDGTPLPAREISGYRILYGVGSNAYVNSVEVEGGSTDAFVVSDLAMLSNTEYCFAVVAIDANGLESAPSNEACAVSPSAASPGSPELMNVTIRLNVQ